MRYVERHIFLVLALFTTALSALCYFVLEKDAPGATDKQYVASVQEQVKAEIQRSKGDLLAISSLLKPDQSLNFDRLKIPTAYPYYIFRHSLQSEDTNRAEVPRLVFWSDYHFVPDYQSMRLVTTAKLIKFEQGTYIVTRQQVIIGHDAFDIFSLINVLYRFGNNNRYLRAGYNPDLFSLDPRQLSTRKRVAAQSIYDDNALFLFSITPPRIDAYRSHLTPVNTLILATLAAVFLGVYVRHKIYWLHRRRWYEAGFGWLCAYLLLLRGLIFFLGVPFLLNETDLFNPKFYAASALAPSLGDQLLNCVVILILSLFVVNNYYRSATYHYLGGRLAWQKVILSLGCVLASYFVFYFCFNVLSSLYEKSQFTQNLTLSLHFSVLKVACLLLFSCISAIYFLKLHLLVSLFIGFNVPRLQGFVWLLTGSLIAAALFSMSNQMLEPVLLLNGLYLLVLYSTGLPRALYTSRYAMLIYLFLAAFVCALTTTYIVYQQETYKDLAQKREFGRQLLAENDELGEFLLYKAQASIAADRFIQRAFLNDTLLVNEHIQQRIRRLYLDAYFDKYEIGISLFNAEGRLLNSSQQASSYLMLIRKYVQKRLKTPYPNLYHIGETGNHFTRDYINFIPVIPDRVQKISSPVGYVVLSLKPRTAKPYSLYPDLVVDNDFTPLSKALGYSYALFSPQHQILHSTGTYNYERKFPFRLLNDAVPFTRGISLYGYRHLALQGKKEHLIVVSSPDYPFKNVFANFSFLYLILVLTIVIILAGYAIKYGVARFELNYLTRIQILLNVAFFLPLLLVVIIILSIISSNYAINQESLYISEARNVAANFSTYLDTYLKGNSSKALMEEELQKMARDARIDVDLFDLTGRLYTSTHLVYQSKHLSEYLNPAAYAHLIDDKENQLLLTESLGSQTYKTAYVAIKAYNGRLLGVMSVPFFYANSVLDQQIIEVISSALSILTALFLLFLVLSYFALHILTGPLKVITQKIKRTNLDKLNEPLPWKSDDEIGLLVDEYNRMLVKLEESKQALSLSEKQSAWREMAKQVAHEIKNPLTPMKLMLQHMKRTMPGTDAPTSRMFQRTFDSLLDQIDNLSDIATSFSDFAKMPLPKNEMFEVTSVLNKAADLYADDVRILLYRQIEGGPVMVMGDRQLMGRILTNLIINGVQSVPTDRQPLIDLRLYTSDGNVNIEVHDNGDGIPESIRSKVFLPNFSTKQDGSGLGLAIAKRGIEHAGGSIWFETAENVGTSFFITLPLTEVSLVANVRNGLTRH